MAFITNFDQSNKADWIFQISAIDSDTGDDIDFTGASVLFVVKDENGCQKLSASIDNGSITQPTSTILQVQFTPSQMETLCPGTYKVGCVYELNGETDQLLVGNISIYDGVAQL
jgi:hypothetical protein